jgi:hypothetical protein
MIAFLLAFLLLLYNSQDVLVLTQTSVICTLYVFLLFWTISAAYENDIYRLEWPSFGTLFDVPFRRGSGVPQDDTIVGESKA